MKTKAESDAESNQRLVDALFGQSDGPVVEKDKDTPSHMQLDLNEDGEPLQMRFVYVDETSCIGCTYCADVARSTFYMNDDAGRARVYSQGGDEPEIVQEAIECCPVNCISYVDHEDLIILETEREGIAINPASIGLPATWSVSMHALPPTKAKLGGSGVKTTCNNCPSRGCKECPMYGVGQNPVYMQRLAEQQAKKEASGEAAQVRADATAARSISKLFDEPGTDPAGVVVPLAGTDPTGVVVPLMPPDPIGSLEAEMPADESLSGGEPLDALFEALYAAPAGFELLDDDDVAEDHAEDAADWPK